MTRFQEALKSENDAQIIASYDAQRLDGYRRVTSKQRKRLESANKRQEALQKFREALQSRDEADDALPSEAKIVQAYQRQSLDGYVEVLESERQELSRACAYLAMRERVREAIQKDDDEQILQAIDLSLVRSWKGLTAGELARLKLAQQRQVAFFF